MHFVRFFRSFFFLAGEGEGWVQPVLAVVRRRGRDERHDVVAEVFLAIVRLQMGGWIARRPRQDPRNWGVVQCRTRQAQDRPTRNGIQTQWSGLVWSNSSAKRTAAPANAAIRLASRGWTIEDETMFSCKPSVQINSNQHEKSNATQAYAQSFSPSKPPHLVPITVRP